MRFRWGVLGTGKMARRFMPVMRTLDAIRRQWGLVYPAEMEEPR